MDKFECMNCKKENYHIETPVVNASGGVCGFNETSMHCVVKGHTRGS